MPVSFRAAVKRLLMVSQGILLADTSEKLDSMNLLRLMAPIAAAMLLPAVALLEPRGPAEAWRLLRAQPEFAGLLIGNASLAYIVNFTNFQITHYTSALTLQVRFVVCQVVAGCHLSVEGYSLMRFYRLQLSNSHASAWLLYYKLHSKHATCASAPLQVLGCAKGVLATVVSVLIFKNPVTLPGGVGYAMTVIGVFAYGYTKMKGTAT